MIKKLVEFQNVNASSFSFNLLNYLCINIAGEIFVYDENLKKLGIRFEGVNFGIFYENYFWTSNNQNSKTFIYNNILDKNYLKEYNFLAGFNGTLDNFSKSDSMLANGFKKNDYTKSYYFELEKETFNLISEIDGLGFNGIYKVINNNLFLSQNNEKFAVFTFENTCVWEICYKDLYKEYESIGAGTTNILKIENHLYVELDKTYCIDLTTGDLKYTYGQKFTNSENEFLYGLQFLSMEKFQLAVLNTKINEVEIVDVSSEFNALKIYPDTRIVVNNGLIYFSQNMGDSIAKIGALDLVSGKILWKYDFEKRSGMIGALKVNGDRIYAHTQDKTLHIFEKTQNEVS